ncbi:galactose-1-epimerase, partial [Rhizobium ruizarguesonis]
MSDSLERDVFGQTQAGETVYRVAIKGGGLTVKIISWGASCPSRRRYWMTAP